MKQIRHDVLQVIQSFLSKGECFTSLDVYCMLGIRFNDESYPIYEEVADAYRQGLMGQYLAEFAHIPLEHGGFANVWRYYLPQSDKREFQVKINNGLVLSTEILGHFPLLDVDMEVTVVDSKIVLVPIRQPTAGGIIVNTAHKVEISSEICSKANKTSGTTVVVTVYPNRIEIV